MTQEFDWLNRSFLQKIVKNQFSCNENDFTIESFEVSRASGKGDNYLGTLLRVKVVIFQVKDKKTVEQFYIVKTSAGDGNMSEEISSQLNAYPKEMEVYGKILPAFEAIWKEHGIEMTFGPKCFGIFHEPVDIIVLEDLSQDGFSIGNRCIGLDLNHALLVVEKLAQFHATSVIYSEKYGKFDKKFENGYFSNELYTDQWKAYYNKITTSFREAMLSWPGFENIVKKSEAWGENVYKHGIKAVEMHPNDFRCLVHGDAWLNNLMFKETSDGPPKDIKLIDFQLASLGTPIQDLFYFMTSSLMEDVRVENFDTIIAHYQESLERSFNSLQFSGYIPSLRDIQSELLRRNMIGVCCAVEGMVIFLMAKGDSLDVELMIGDSEEAVKYRHKCYSNPVFVSAAQKYVKFLYKRGLLDLPRN
uniref:CSON004997 protein n=1 Tax=Culicoides sonorensis TaxID=179676 RepID=A0A336MPH4_CULSO